ncbi:hypothetical protein P0D91_10100 [Pseudomonas sp. CBSPBW29]|uniref:Uncharacterized protein n=1 Tax=Pseudomonas yamanorum TaxID=515393 RepID=A0ABU1CY71_9PSED|nr:MULTISPECIES: hypothetical protein [Pseudomonas]WEL44524.1 hypothetical protein P0D91_10100 [Pseudomonas sp. CBSPBW29]WEL65612.1 hypothetical protein P0D93_04225 [Pseudomonas sp. CBSPGW29]WEL69080.1 hypothetical protein P0D94_23545 [Pseudomonas sp. CBSPCGW29]WEL76080.1 hypothetical protein P0D92_29610 [Pseudomonas sp. CBSPAW29]WEL85348.1 hypothetical protein P0D95_16205 [Pseudomonas sp. CBSPCAW29]WEL88137.1 hypothetical protein P0D90_31920 [Pseudomonas sp. CBSPCBW29]
MSETEIQSTSPDDHYRVEVTPWEARNTQWVCSPRIVDTGQGSCVFQFEDVRWSADQSVWLNPTTVELKLRKFPGDKTGRGVSVVIDCAGLVARLGDGSVVELSVLEAALDAIELK